MYLPGSAAKQPAISSEVHPPSAITAKVVSKIARTRRKLAT